MPGKKTYIANIFIPIILGTIIYFVFRPDTYISIYLRQLFYIAGWNPFSIIGLNYPAVIYLRNFGCDILWAYALVFAVHYFFDKTTRSLYLTAAICLGFDFFIELLQYINIISGTFDMMDVIVEAVATFVAVGILFKLCKEEKHDEEKLDS